MVAFYGGGAAEGRWEWGAESKKLQAKSQELSF